MMRLGHLFPDHIKKTNQKKKKAEIAGGRQQGKPGAS